MNFEPRQREDYSVRQIEAARRVLVDLGQVLKSFEDCLVVVGGWIPELMLQEVEEPHVGSLDVDLALDAEKLKDGQYADLVNSLLATRRYTQAEEPFRLHAQVDLDDGQPSVRVDVDFLKSPEAKIKRTGPGLPAPSGRLMPADAMPPLKIPNWLPLPEK